MKIFIIGVFCESRLFRHSRESGNPELLGPAGRGTGFRAALRLAGMTISLRAESFLRPSGSCF
jgi:hypothetical protein